MTNLVKVFLLLLLALAGSIDARAQYQNKVDSLTRVLDILERHEEKVGILLELSKLTAITSEEQSLFYGERALTIARNIDYKGGIVVSLEHLVELHAEQETFEKALEYALELQAIQLQDEDLVAFVYTVNRTGKLYQSMGDISKAIESFDAAKTVARSTQFRKGEALSEANKGGLFFEQEKLLEALDYFLEALKIYPEGRFDESFGDALFGLGSIYRKQGNGFRSLEYLSNAISVYEQVGNQEGLVKATALAGDQNFDLGDLYEALSYYQRSLNIARQIGFTEYIISGYKKLSETYAKIGNFERAHEFLSLYAATKDTRELSELEARSEAEAQKLKVLELEKDRVVQESEIRTKNVLMYSLGGLFLSISVFMVFLFRQYRLKQQAIEALRKAIHQAKRSQEEKEKFLAYTSHEIRTPLNAVIGMTEMLQKTNLIADQQRYVNTIKSSSDNILIIVNDILDLTKIDSGKIEFEAIDFMLSELVEEITYMLQVKAQAKGLKLTISCDPELPSVINGDPLRLSQILLNLVNNAIKFTEKGEVRIGVHVLRRSEDSMRIGFTVVDTGIGIRQEKLSSVFNRFEQEDKDTTRKYGGAGLGLSITKQLVELQGGNISVRSKYGEGTTFSVRMMFKVGDEAALRTNHKQEGVVAGNEIGAFRMLLVDDNELNQTILRDLLLDWNPHIEIIMAGDGKEAVQALKQQDYDVIMMDIQMPRMNGYNASRYIREHLPAPKSETPIVAMTAHALSGIADKCMEAGMDDYVSKPINTAVLIGKIEKLLKHKEKRAVRREVKYFKAINLDHLNQLTNKNPEKMVRYIDIFLKNLDTDLQVLVENCEDEDWPAFAKTAHKMKGTSSYMGIKALESIFATAQTFGTIDTTYEQVRAMVDKIESICQIAGEELKEVREELKLGVTNH